MLRGEIKSPATVRTEILQMMLRREQEEPAAHLSELCHLWIRSSGHKMTQWSPTNTKLFARENQTAAICESLLALWVSAWVGVFCICFMSCFFIAFLAEPSRAARAAPAEAAADCQAALIVSQLQVQHLWAIQKNLPKIQSFTVFAFHWLPLISPFITLNKTRFNSSYH